MDRVFFFHGYDVNPSTHLGLLQSLATDNDALLVSFAAQQYQGNRELPAEKLVEKQQENPHYSTLKFRHGPITSQWNETKDYRSDVNGSDVDSNQIYTVAAQHQLHAMQGWMPKIIPSPQDLAAIFNAESLPSHYDNSLQADEKLLIVGHSAGGHLISAMLVEAAKKPEENSHIWRENTTMVILSGANPVDRQSLPEFPTTKPNIVFIQPENDAVIPLKNAQEAAKMWADAGFTVNFVAGDWGVPKLGNHDISPQAIEVMDCIIKGKGYDKQSIKPANQPSNLIKSSSSHAFRL
ncbi:MAG: hypothetical protein ACOYK8_07050 [Alphaproteobacteria bacterium]